MSDEPTLIEILGPNAYIEAEADALDGLLPGLGLGQLLRDLYRIVLDSAFGYTAASFLGGVAATSGADTELDYYGGDQ